MTTFVSEFTTNHMGNLNLLLRMVEQAAWAGCDLIKMQKKDVESFYSREKLDAPFTSPYGKTYRDYRALFEFGREDFDRFDKKCRQHGIEWFATVQDRSSLHFLANYNLSRYKVASCNARNLPLLHEIADTIPSDRTIVISVGGSTLGQIEQALRIFQRHRIWLLHCVARYPCPAEELRLGNIAELKRRFGSSRIKIGYSGHEQGISASLAAIAGGAEIVERHFCLSRHSFVHHIECSLEPEEYRALIRAARNDRITPESYAQLPDSAFACNFGMSRAERAFLLDQTYDRRFVGPKSAFQADTESPGRKPQRVLRAVR